MDRTKSPFPGMDPYLEHPAGWRGVHAAIIACLWQSLSERLPPGYYVRGEDRVFVDTEPIHGVMPDVRVIEHPAPSRVWGTAILEADPVVVVPVPAEEVNEHYIEIRDAQTGHRVVTVLEILSPANKRPGSDGRRSYQTKQREVLESDANLVEIDLLRGGEHVTAVPAALARARCGAYHYLVVVRRAARRDERELYPVRLSARLPRIAVPLKDPDPDVVVDLQAILDRVYAMGSYGSTIEYARPPEPPLAEADAVWARTLPGM